MFFWCLESSRDGLANGWMSVQHETAKKKRFFFIKQNFTYQEVQNFNYITQLVPPWLSDCNIFGNCETLKCAALFQYLGNIFSHVYATLSGHWPCLASTTAHTKSGKLFQQINIIKYSKYNIIKFQIDSEMDDWLVSSKLVLPIPRPRKLNESIRIETMSFLQYKAYVVFLVCWSAKIKGKFYIHGKFDYFSLYNRGKQTSSPIWTFHKYDGR